MLFHGCESMLERANCIKMQMPDPGNGSDTSVLLDLLSMSTVVNIEQINVKTMKTIRKPTLQADQHCFEYFFLNFHTDHIWRVLFTCCPCFQIFQEESRHHNSRRAIVIVLPQPPLPRNIWSVAVFYWVSTSCLSPCWVPCCLLRWAPPPSHCHSLASSPPLRLAHPNQEEVQRLHLSPPLLPPWPWSCSQPSLPTGWPHLLVLLDG